MENIRKRSRMGWLNFSLLIVLYSTVACNRVYDANERELPPEIIDTNKTCDTCKTDTFSSVQQYTMVELLNDKSVGSQAVEHRNPESGEIVIDKAPYMIKMKGKYIVTKDLVANGGAILVYSSDVILDLNGYKITYGNGVVPTDKNVMTYNSNQTGNIGHHGICAPKDPYYNHDWKDSLGWNKSFSNVVIKNGRIVSGNGTGLAYSPAMELTALVNSRIENVIIFIDADDSQGFILGKQTKLINCSIINNVKKVSNRHAILSVIEMGASDTVENCLLYGGPQMGINAKANAVIKNNIIELNTIVTNGYAIVGGKNAIIQNNCVKNFTGRGLGFGDTSWVVSNNYIEAHEGYNAEYDRLDVHGLKLEYGIKGNFNNNIFVSVAKEKGTPTPLNLNVVANSGNVVRNNTFYAIAHPTSIYSCGVFLIETNGVGCTVSNNIFNIKGQQNAGGVFCSWDGGGNHTFDSCFFNALQNDVSLVKWGNNSDAKNVVFDDCIFSSNMILHNKSNYGSGGIISDYKIQASLTIKPIEACTLSITKDNDATFKSINVVPANSLYKTFLSSAIIVAQGGQNIKVDTNCVYKVSIASKSTHAEFKVIPLFAMEYDVGLMGKKQILTPQKIMPLPKGVNVKIPLIVTDGSGEDEWSIQGHLPDGMHLTGAAIEGTPSGAGEFSVELSNKSGGTDLTKKVIFTVIENPSKSYESRIETLLNGVQDAIAIPQKDKI